MQILRRHVHIASFACHMAKNHMARTDKPLWTVTVTPNSHTAYPMFQSKWKLPKNGRSSFSGALVCRAVMCTTSQITWPNEIISAKKLSKKATPAPAHNLKSTNPCPYPCRPIFLLTLRKRRKKTRPQRPTGEEEPLNDSCCWLTCAVADQRKRSCWS